jgi:phosphoglycerate dehydrogenase-like enzyme
LRALGARILYSGRRPMENAIGEFVTLRELLSASDIISLHAPLTEETRHIINGTSIATMKPGAILINTARGGLVDEAALVEALQSGKLAAAGLDTFAQEPVDPKNPLLALDNVVATPHVAWLTLETFDRSMDVLSENCRRLGAGLDLLHRIA